MSMYQQFQTDEGLEQNGVVLNYGEFRVTVRRAGGANRAFAKGMEALMRPHRRALQAGTLSDTVADDIMRRAYAKWVIAAWEVPLEGEPDQWRSGIEGPNGDVLPATEENVTQALAALPDLFADIREQSNSIALYRAQLREEDLGN